MKIIPGLVTGLFCACAPAGAAVINLTTNTIAGNAPNTLTGGSGTFRGGFINGALFREPSVTGSSGSGAFRDLFRISPPNGPGNTTEAGYNRAGTIHTSVPNGFDPFLRVGDLIEDASRSSYIFVVDLNESGSLPERYLSVDDLKIWIGGTTDPSVLPNSLTALTTQFGAPVYDMNPSGQQNVVLLDATLSSGSGGGGGDLFVFIPKSYFPPAANPNSFVYIYTRMGGYTGAPGFDAGATPEQVSIPGKTIIGTTASTVSTISSGVPVPEPGTAAGLLVALGLGIGRRRR
jgi:hypothetical protein